MVKMFTSWKNVEKEYAPHEERVFEIIDLPKQTAYITVNDAVRGEIQRKDVSFFYGNKQALYAVSLMIRKNL